MADVTLSYKGSDILELSDSGSATLKTGGKYCEDDIEVEYVKPSGGSLPSIISKIDGGSFTLASDTASDDQSISHNLGVVPKGFVIWTEDEISGTIAVRYISSCYASTVNIVDKNSNNYIACGTSAMLYNGNASVISNNSHFTTTIVQNYMDAVRIRWNNGLLFYKSGLTYKWLAWA